MKVCSICNLEKEAHSFNKRIDSKDGLEGQCTSCRKEKREGNPSFTAERKRDYCRKHDIKRKGKRWGYHLKRTYGLSEEEYFRMHREQEGCCAICKLPEDPNEHYGKFVVDHCHKTGKVRGLLCNRCNLMLGNCKDDMRILNEGIVYLKIQQG